MWGLIPSLGSYLTESIFSDLPETPLLSPMPDAGLLGTPVVLVGGRQSGREHDAHVTPVDPEAQQISQAIAQQLARGRYPVSSLYGDGYVSARISQALIELRPYVQKRLAFDQ